MSDSIPLYLHTFHTMLYLYNFPCMFPLRCSHTTYIVSLSWFHPASIIYIYLSAENAIPQTVEHSDNSQPNSRATDS